MEIGRRRRLDLVQQGVEVALEVRIAEARVDHEVRRHAPLQLDVGLGGREGVVDVVGVGRAVLTGDRETVLGQVVAGRPARIVVLLVPDAELQHAERQLALDPRDVAVCAEFRVGHLGRDVRGRAGRLRAQLGTDLGRRIEGHAHVGGVGVGAVAALGVPVLEGVGVKRVLDLPVVGDLHVGVDVVEVRIVVRRLVAVIGLGLRIIRQAEVGAEGLDVGQGRALGGVFEGVVGAGHEGQGGPVAHLIDVLIMKFARFSEAWVR